jgi:hypothetical protein
MAKINARAKGAAGERELATWLHESFPIAVKPERNLEQVRNGGSDLIVPPFMFEVKRVETLALGNWWQQVNASVNGYFSKNGVRLEPVVAFRQNKQEWNFLASAKHMGCDNGYVRMSALVFRNWVVRNWKFS